jgi:hypothetical protein
MSRKRSDERRSRRSRSRSYGSSRSGSADDDDGVRLHVADLGTLCLYAFISPHIYSGNNTPPTISCWFRNHEHAGLHIHFQYACMEVPAFEVSQKIWILVMCVNL